MSFKMGKFAGFLKRAKNFALKGVNTVAKGLKTAKNIWNNVITKPGVDILNTLLPITKPITDTLYDVDDYFNKGIDWVIDKTSSTNSLSKTNKGNKNNYTSLPSKPIFTPINMSSGYAGLPSSNRNLNFNS